MATRKRKDRKARRKKREQARRYAGKLCGLPIFLGDQQVGTCKEHLRAAQDSDLIV